MLVEAAEKSHRKEGFILVEKKEMLCVFSQNIYEDRKERKKNARHFSIGIFLLYRAIHTTYLFCLSSSCSTCCVSIASHEIQVVFPMICKVVLLLRTVPIVFV